MLCSIFTDSSSHPLPLQNRKQTQCTWRVAVHVRQIRAVALVILISSETINQGVVATSKVSPSLMHARPQHKYDRTVWPVQTQSQSFCIDMFVAIALHICLYLWLGFALGSFSGVPSQACVGHLPAKRAFSDQAMIRRATFRDFLLLRMDDMQKIKYTHSLVCPYKARMLLHCPKSPFRDHDFQLL